MSPYRRQTAESRSPNRTTCSLRKPFGRQTIVGQDIEELGNIDAEPRDGPGRLVVDRSVIS
jgi:hypothetical protein